MLTKVQKWGNSIALRIPKSFADEIQIAADSPVELTIEAGKLIIAPVEPEAYSLEELLAAVTPENIHAEVDWGEPVGNEAW
jgi:antitoxin MazE